MTDAPKTNVHFGLLSILTNVTNPALGTAVTESWPELTRRFRARPARPQDNKDGLGFVPCVFKPCTEYPDKQPGELIQVRLPGVVWRKSNQITRRAMAVLDVEQSKSGGAATPIDRVRAALRDQYNVWIIYASHNYTPQFPRYRIAIPLAEDVDIPPHWRIVEHVAATLELTDFLDRSKLSENSGFYFPSMPIGSKVDFPCFPSGVGAPLGNDDLKPFIDRMRAEDAERERRREEASAEASRRRSTGDGKTFMERARQFLPSVTDYLLAQKHERHRDGRWLYPDSKTGVAGVDVLTGDDGD